MTGDSISDAAALQTAYVGFCMGDGCDVAKDASDMIIADGSFDSIMKSVKWGRALYTNVKNFLTFQLTVNIVLVSVTAIGGMTVGHTPLNVV